MIEKLQKTIVSQAIEITELRAELELQIYFAKIAQARVKELENSK